jgi:uncharacterized protein YraI
MKAKLFTSAAAVALFAIAGSAFAQQAVVAASDLDVRAGPGSEHQVVGIIAAESEATVLGCDRVSGWCEVESGQVAGWVNSDYLDDLGPDIYINEGPVGSIQNIEPGAPVISYIESNRYDPVQVETEIRVGEVLPGDVELHAIPDYEYRYVYVNDRPVLVEPDTRRIVYIVR